MQNIKKYLLAICVTTLGFTCSADDLNIQAEKLCGAKSCAQVFKEMKRYARNGSAHAESILALLYRGGVGTDLNDDMSVKFMRKAARKGLAYAQHDLGILYKVGYLVDKDEEEAIKWLTKAANAGHRPSIEVLAAEGKISEQEKSEFLQKYRQPELEKDEQRLLILSDRLTLSDLADYLRSQGFGKKRTTGSRLNGRGCGDLASNCISYEMDDAGKMAFAVLTVKANGMVTARQSSQRGRGK